MFPHALLSISGIIYSKCIYIYIFCIWLQYTCTWLYMWEKSNSEIQLQKDINKIGGLKFWTFNKHIHLHGFNLAQTFRVSIHVMEGRFGCCAFTCHLCLQHGHFSGTHLRKWAEPLLQLQAASEGNTCVQGRKLRGREHPFWEEYQ